MAEVILMPRLSDTMTEGVVAAWHKNVGDTVKKGDLLGVSAYKFKINKQEILLSYSVGPEELLLIALGTHENFYRDMKR